MRRSRTPTPHLPGHPLVCTGRNKHIASLGHIQGRIQDFKLGRAHLKKLRRAEGGPNIFGVFRVKNHDFTPKKIIFFPIAEGGAKNFGVFRVKNHYFTPKNHIFSNFRGARAGCPPPLDPPLIYFIVVMSCIVKRTLKGTSTNVYSKSLSIKVSLMFPNNT
jgi:hypothetical protein